METQASVSRWTTETFGPAGSDFRAVVRANEEMAELLHAVATGEYEKATVEAADVFIVLCRVADRIGIDLVEEAKSASKIASYFTHIPVWSMAAAANVCLAHGIQEIGMDGNASGDLGRAVCSLAYLIKGLSRPSDEAPVDLLWAVVNRKMQVNRSRVWRLDGTGHGYHVKEAQE